MMKSHFVTFYSPGTFFAEQTTRPIKSWGVDRAVSMSSEIKERYGALPYGFRFSTRERGDNDLDSRETKTSPMYFLGGDVFTLAQLKKRKNPDDRILISNMECNHYKRIIVNKNSWQWTQPLMDDDVVIDVERPTQ
mgnify:FL=1